MKLTAKARKSLYSVLSDIERVEKFILSDDIEVVKDYGVGKVAINKHVGSDLHRLFAAKDTLRIFLDSQ